jgi:hypothetical protein
VRVQDMGEPRGERRIDTATSCEDLASGAALAVSMAIDPIAALGPAPSGEPEGSEPEQQPEPEPKLTEPAEPEPAEPEPPPPPPPALSLRVPERALTSERGRFVAWAGARAWSGVVPALSVGPSLGLDYARGLWSLGLDAFVVPAQTERAFGSARAVSVSLYAAELTPCVRLSELQACALFASGALLARGEGVARPQTGQSFFAAAGLRLGYSLALGRFSLTPSTQVAVRLQRSVLFLDDTPVWTTPRALGALGLDVGYEL